MLLGVNCTPRGVADERHAKVQFTERNLPALNLSTTALSDRTDSDFFEDLVSAATRETVK